MSGDKRARLKEWLESGEARLHPLTFPQRELWEASRVPVADPANHICCLIFTRGAITIEQCEAAVRRVVERQDVLRLSFLPGKSGPLQMVRQHGDSQFRYRELTPEESTPEAIEAIAQGIFRQPFDLLQGPLYRVELLRKNPNEHVLVFAIHHAIADGWTLGVFVQELCAAYLQIVRGMDQPLPAITQAYSAWGAAERAVWPPEQLERCAKFWKTQLAGAPRLWPDAPAAGILHREITFLDEALVKAVRELARQHGATLFSTLLAVFQLAVSRWRGADDIVVGSPIANRSKQPIRETMGYFAGNIPLRRKVDAGQTFSETLRAVHDTTLDAFAHAMPFAELVRALGESTNGRHPVYQVRFALQNHPIPDVDLPTLSAKLHMRSTGTARFDLGCEVTEMEEKLEVVWLSRPELFSTTSMDELKQLFQGLLTAVCRNPGTRVSDLP